MPYPSHARAVCLTIAFLAAAAPGPAALAAQAADTPPAPIDGVDYVVYDRAGRRVPLAEVVTAAGRAEVLLVGEEHDDMVAHALEAELYGRAVDAHGAASGIPGRTVVLSLEMFERDVQYVLDEYLDGLVTEDHFLRGARPWDDYEERYRALVEEARAHFQPVVAANAPRRYVNRVTREGPESLAALPDQAKRFLPPLPYPGPTERYRAQWDALMNAAMAGAPAPDTVGAGADSAQAPESSGHGVPANAIHAQALWDAAMGHAVTNALVEHLGALVVHFAGSFHVERGTGIPERIDDYRPGTRVTTVVMTKTDDVTAWSSERHAELADYVVLTRRPAGVTN
jgi:uncharacterized iron-regulated protein